MKKLKEYIKENITIGKSIWGVMKNFPVICTVLFILLILSLLGEPENVSIPYKILQVLGLIFMTAFIVIILICFDNPSKIILKNLLFSISWLISAVILVDSKRSVELIIRITAAFEFIFLGCLLPNWFTEIEKMTIEYNNLTNANNDLVTDSMFDTK